MRPAFSVAAMETHADDYLWGMAFHEAGHAVVAWSLNLRVESIYIREIGAGNSATKTEPPDHLPLMDQLATLAAGLEAGQALTVLCLKMRATVIA